MKRLLYLFAIILAVLTAIGYVIGKDWEEETLVQQAEMSEAQKLKIWNKLARQGDPDAQYNLGVYYEKVRVDYLNAQKWFRVAATKGQHPGAQYKLAQLFMNGRGVENNMSEAMKWFRLSANGNDPRGQYFLGISNRDGWEKKPDWIEAYKWFLLANRKSAMVLAEDPRFDTKEALVELDRKMSQFNRDEAKKRADNWRPK